MLKNDLLAALDKAIAEGDWEGSLFFKNIEKRLHQLRNHVLQEITCGQPARPEQRVNTSLRIAAGYTEPVFISLYQADGAQLQSWQQALKALADYSVSRPVYQEREHVEAMIRSKADSKREAYVLVYVRLEDMIPPSPGKNLKDKLGQPLLTLKEHAVKLENVVEFVHLGQVYQVVEGQLVKVE